MSEPDTWHDQCPRCPDCGQHRHAGDCAEPEAVTEDLTFIPAAVLRRLYSCPDCEDQFISPNAMATHNSKEHPS